MGSNEAGYRIREKRGPEKIVIETTKEKKKKKEKKQRRKEKKTKNSQKNKDTRIDKKLEVDEREHMEPFSSPFYFFPFPKVLHDEALDRKILIPSARFIAMPAFDKVPILLVEIDDILIRNGLLRERREGNHGG